MLKKSVRLGLLMALILSVPKAALSDPEACCYMIDSEGQFTNLEVLCGASEPANPTADVTSESILEPSETRTDTEPETETYIDLLNAAGITLHKDGHTNNLKYEVWKRETGGYYYFIWDLNQFESGVLFPEAPETIALFNSVENINNIFVTPVHVETCYVHGEGVCEADRVGHFCSISDGYISCQRGSL